MKGFETFVTGMLLAITVAILLAIMLAYPIMIGWNSFMAGVLGLPSIGFWDAAMLYLLTRLLIPVSHSNSSK